MSFSPLRREELDALLARLDPDHIQTATTHFVVGDDRAPRREEHDTKDLGGFFTEHALQEFRREVRCRQRLSQPHRLARLVGFDRVPNREFAKHRG